MILSDACENSTNVSLAVVTSSTWISTSTPIAKRSVIPSVREISHLILVCRLVDTSGSRLVDDRRRRRGRRWERNDCCQLRRNARSSNWTTRRFNGSVCDHRTRRTNSSRLFNVSNWDLMNRTLCRTWSDLMNETEQGRKSIRSQMKRRGSTANHTDRYWQSQRLAAINRHVENEKKYSSWSIGERFDYIAVLGLLPSAEYDLVSLCAAFYCSQLPILCSSTACS